MTVCVVSLAAPVVGRCSCELLTTLKSSGGRRWPCASQHMDAVAGVGVAKAGTPGPSRDSGARRLTQREHV